MEIIAGRSSNKETSGRFHTDWAKHGVPAAEASQEPSARERGLDSEYW